MSSELSKKSLLSGCSLDRDQEKRVIYTVTESQVRIKVNFLLKKKKKILLVETQNHVKTVLGMGVKLSWGNGHITKHQNDELLFISWAVVMCDKLSQQESSSTSQGSTDHNSSCCRGPVLCALTHISKLSASLSTLGQTEAKASELL